MCEHCDHEHEERNETLFLKFIVTSVLFVAGFFISEILFIAAYLVIGFDVLKKALKNILKGEIFDECFLMSIATIGAICIKEFPEAVMVMFLYNIGEFLQDKAIDKSKKSISKLMNIKPEYANISVDGVIQQVPPETVKTDDIIIIKAGEKIPLDGIVEEGESSLDLSNITGESKFKSVKKSDNVYSGSINVNGILKIKVTKDYKNSTVSKILDMLEYAKSKKTKTENFITRFAKVYTPFVVILAVIIATVPAFFAPEQNWLERALVFLVISCPCALVLSIPLGFFAGIGKCSKSGILVKGSVYLERLSNIKTAVFDKTGTLTNGNFEVVKINSDNKDILKYASYAEAASNHPIALAIKRVYPTNSENTNIKEFSGLGVIAYIDGNKIMAGSAKFINTQEVEEEGTVVYVSVNDNYIGNIVIADTIKTGSKELIEKLNKEKIHTVMLTGDNINAAKNVQKELNIKEAHAELLPHQKIEKLETLLSKKGNTVFLGDGTNDAPALQRADVGISMGALGADAAIEASDVAIMDDDPLKFLEAVKISKKTMRMVKQNIVFAIGTKVLFLILGAYGFVSMWGAIFADTGVTLIAILNSLRILQNR